MRLLETGSDTQINRKEIEEEERRNREKRIKETEILQAT